MRILTILNVDDAPAGLIGVHLEKNGATCESINPHDRDELPPSPEGYDGMIVVGGPHRMMDPVFYPSFFGRFTTRRSLSWVFALGLN